MSVTAAKDFNDARPREPKVHQELPRTASAWMLASAFAIDTSESCRSRLVRFRLIQYIIAQVSVKAMPVRAHPSLYGNCRKGSRGDCTLSILSRLCIDPNLKS